MYSGLVYSTVWREDMHVKIVWITMLALSDWHGIVAASVPGLAVAAGVSVEQCRDALARFMAPDPDSRTKEHEGRRIEEVDGGWLILNYAKYREMRDEERRKEQIRQAVARHREKKKAGLISGKRSNPSKPRKAHTSTSTDTSTERTTGERASDEIPTTDSQQLEPEMDPLDGGDGAQDPEWLGAQQVENEIRLSTDALRTKLYGLVKRMTAADPQRRDPTELMRLVTAYEREGKLVGGVVNASLLSHERLEKSIADAEWCLADWAKGNGDGA